MSQSSVSRLLSLCLLLVANALFIYVVHTTGRHYLHGENALLENLQVLLLVTGAIGYLWLSDKTPDSARFLYLALALLSFSFMLREMDMELLPVPVVFHLLGSGLGRNLMLVLLWGLLFYTWLNRESNKLEFLRAFLVSRIFLVLASALLLLICSALIDKGLIAPGQPRLFEELAEINAYLFMLLPVFLRVWRLQASRPVGELIPCRLASNEPGNHYQA